MGIALVFGGMVMSGVASGEGKEGVKVVPVGEKLERIVVPRVEIAGATLGEALEFLRIRSEDLDTTAEKGEPGRGVNFILKDPDGTLSEKGVTLTLSRVPLALVLDYVTRFAGATYRVDAHAVVVGKAEDLEGGEGILLSGNEARAGRRIFERLRDVRLPAVELTDVSAEEVLAYFRAASEEAGPGVGLNFVFKEPREPVGRITLRMRDVPMGVALRYACELSGVVYTVHPNAVMIGSADELLMGVRDPGAHAYGRSGVRGGGEGLAAKLRGLVVPEVELRSATLEEALDLVRESALAKERAAGVANPVGINIVNLAQDNGRRVTLSLAEMPGWELMGYITGLTETAFRVERQAVVVDWRLPRRGVEEAKGEVKGEGGEGAPGDEERPQVLQVPVLMGEGGEDAIFGPKISPLVVPGL